MFRMMLLIYCPSSTPSHPFLRQELPGSGPDLLVGQAGAIHRKADDAAVVADQVRPAGGLPVRHEMIHLPGAPGGLLHRDKFPMFRDIGILQIIPETKVVKPWEGGSGDLIGQFRGVLPIGQGVLPGAETAEKKGAEEKEKRTAKEAEAAKKPKEKKTVTAKKETKTE